MGALRNSLKVIFDEQDADNVIKAFLDVRNPAQFPVSQIDKDTYCSAYVNVSPSNTQDQAHSAFCLAKEKWCHPSDDSFLSFCPDSSIFNIPLHFCSQVLLEKNLSPVCKFEHLLKWHEVTSLIGEDILTTSFLASSDISCGLERTFFSWPAVVDHDNSTLHRLFSEEMADLHNHLQGTGFVAGLNWMSLMNDVTGRRHAFESKKFSHSKAYHTKYENDTISSSLYVQVMKAAVIRLFLFSNINTIQGLPDFDFLKKVLHEKSSIGIDFHIQTIFSYLETARRVYGHLYYGEYDNKWQHIDYLLLKTASFQKSNSTSNIHFLLSGERALMYGVFKKIYRGEDKNGVMSMLFYAYLLIKNKLQQELVQTNTLVGFRNFQDYQNRKKLFLKDGSIYSKLLVQSAIKSTVDGIRPRYLETRFSPPIDKNELSRFIIRCDSLANNITGKSFPVLSHNQRIFEQRHSPEKWYYTAHFIKQDDSLVGMHHIQNPRHWNVRQTIKLQCMAISHIRCYHFRAALRLVGIDAAGSEISARPEVFAQGFRFLRKCRGGDYFLLGTSLKSLGVTYHVGEDFNDIVDGLRSVRESLLFLEMRCGDRIGHGLVLGTDVFGYYKRHGFTIPMSKQCIIDNMAFMLVEASELEGFEKIRIWLMMTFEKYVSEIYGPKMGKPVSFLSYYQSWLLRGDDPNCFSSWEDRPDDSNRRFSDWNRSSMVSGDEHDNAIYSTDARHLYHLYHFNYDVKLKGSEYEQLLYPKDVIPVIARLQEKILTEVERKHIAIECNPTSNLKIGEINKFIDHPISRFYMLRKPESGRMHNICVSINTDDKGVFSTSLEREYSLIAAAFDKEYEHDSLGSPTPREVFSWLDEIRRMSLEMIFDPKSTC